MSPAPLVTVIVPGRDVEAYAPAAIASLQAQTEQRWRAILIDDGSADATGDVFAAAASTDPRFTLIRHAEPQGLSAARNAGLDRITTPYLGFLDGDDELTPSALERMTGTLTETGSDFVAAAYVRSRIHGTGIPDTATETETNRTETNRVEPRPSTDLYRPGRVQPWVAAATAPARRRTTILEHPWASANIVAWSKVSRSAFWSDLRFPVGVAYEDQIVAQRMYTTATAFDVIPDVAVHWRLRADGTSITQSKDRLPTLRDYLAALRGGIDILRDAGATDAIVARLEVILAMDLPPLERIAASHPDPAYADALATFLDELHDLPEFGSATPDPGMAEALAW
ncbi:glycosyltransferase involved in cell wall biosynthesis [Microbacterium resistens]|uniref:Glycosyltransferase involved in cell wall biosynthesis n=1 Tax=Microbacterium resistens TaxID=156977 RepID=A0ABU1S7K4_9MICO|nr:glycosyltransferase family 2 protein [Microbacterium resistens]MDR6865570.1 glycosyltransferase involved in cell wall biosynthesis [Microbacterium resistens]